MVTVGSTIIASSLMATMPVFVAMLVRFAVASLLLAVVLLALRRPLPRLAPASWRLLLIQAAIGSVGYTGLLLLGLTMTLASDASVIAGALPALATLLAVLILRERPGFASWVAVLLATAGLVVVQFGQQAGHGGQSRWLGNALVLLAVACEALFLLLNKRLKEPLDPLWTAALMSMLPTLMCFPVVLYLWLAGQALMLSQQGLWAALYYAVVPTALGFWLWYFGSSRVSGTEAGIFTTLFPISGLLLAAAILDEPIESRHWVGMALVVMAIALSAWGASKPTGSSNSRTTHPPQSATR
jgi:drug/metabolite transporter (DMT)-like permease